MDTVWYPFSYILELTLDIWFYFLSQCLSTYELKGASNAAPDITQGPHLMFCPDIPLWTVLPGFHLCIPVFGVVAIVPFIRVYIGR